MPPLARWRGHTALLVACAAFVTLALTFVASPWAPRRGLLAAGAVAGSLLVVVSLRLLRVRLGRLQLVAILLAVPLGMGTGVLGWYYRGLRERATSPWTLMDVPPGAGSSGSPAASGGLRDSIAGAAFARLRSKPVRDINTFPPLPPGELDLRSDQLLDAVFQLGESPPVELPRDLTWTEDPFGDRTWQWLLHSMEYVVPLTERYLEGGGLAYLKRAEDLILDWIDENQLYLFEPAYSRNWHDHGTALRLRAWLPFWEAWRTSPLADPVKAERLLGAMAEHAMRLADPAFYTEEHNHGIDQDIALLAASLAFPEFRDAPAWRALARERLARQVAAAISPRGVHLEHSPGYHIFTLGQLAAAVDLARRNGLELEPPDLRDLVRSMARAAAYMIRPDGRVVQVGDTVAWPPFGLEHPILGPLAEDDPVLRCALTRGREGTPGETAVVYEKAGFAIFRDAWGKANDFERAFHLFFTAAAHEGHAHKQADSLSFVLYARGHPLLVDAGYHSSHSADPGRQYALHARAHNLVLVDGEGFHGFSGRIEESRIGGSFACVRALHDDYPHFRHTRTLVYLRPAAILLLDELRARDATAEGRAHDFDQLFHLAPDLEAEVLRDGAEVRASPRGAGLGPVLRIRQLLGKTTGCSVVRGATDPLQGWISRAHMKLEPAPVAIFRARGEEATFVTLLEVLDGPAQLPAAEGEEASAEYLAAEGRIVIRWREGARIRECRLLQGETTEVEVGEAAE